MDYIPVSAREAMNTQIQLSNTAHQREVADLQAAGLNPVLSAHGSGASTPGIQSDSLSEINDFLGTINSALDVAKAGLSGNGKASALESFVMQADPKSGKSVGDAHSAMKNLVFSLIPENGTFLKIGNYNLQNSTVRNAIASGIDHGGFDANALGSMLSELKSADPDKRSLKEKVFGWLDHPFDDDGIVSYVGKLVHNIQNGVESEEEYSSFGRSHRSVRGRF